MTARLKSLGQVTVDDEGRPLRYPSALFFDQRKKELYLINVGASSVVIYGSDYFPVASMGAGRGIEGPRGGFLASNDLIYVCQSRTKDKPPRITVLNAALFPLRDIPIAESPDSAEFVPRQVAVSRDGLLYVVGESNRGVLVLDEDGVVLRKLKPMDLVAAEALAPAGKATAGAAKRKGSGPTASGESGGSGEAPKEGKDSRVDIPEEFRPQTTQEQARAGKKVMGPVRIRALTIDKAGRIYLVSAETGKVYVYGPDESFLFSFGKKGGSPGTLSTPSGVAVDEDRGLVYVVDYMRHTVLGYDLSGNLQLEFGGRGTGEGWFNYPADIAVIQGGQVVVADQFNNRAQALEVEPILYEVPSIGVSKTAEPSAEAEDGSGSEPPEKEPGAEGTDEVESKE
ncbi:MAG: hypothetical protein HY900_23590 [Deltaproteobacteria bacterium]|nr:hypothetical protein [Deltaproteobacteria bacterium]